MDISIGDIGVAVAEIGRAGPPGPPGVGGHIELSFSYSSIGANLLVGNVPIDTKILACFVDIIDPFAGVSFTIGTLANPALIDTVPAADTATQGLYKTEPNIEEIAQFWLFPSFIVAPSSGSGLVTIYYS